MYICMALMRNQKNHHQIFIEKQESRITITSTTSLMKEKLIKLPEMFVEKMPVPRIQKMFKFMHND